MTTADSSKIECWKCGNEQSVTYGGESDKGTRRCEGCGVVIAEVGIDTLTIPEEQSQATAIKKRRGDFTKLERLKRWLGWS